MAYQNWFVQPVVVDKVFNILSHRIVCVNFMVRGVAMVSEVLNRTYERSVHQVGELCGLRTIEKIDRFKSLASTLQSSQRLVV
jgi:hypothetical protein